MLPGLIAIADLLVALSGWARQEEASTRQRDALARSRPSHPSPRRSIETIDGMLYVGLRPTTHDAA